MITTEKYILTLPRIRVKHLLEEFADAKKTSAIKIRVKEPITYRVFNAEIHIEVTGDADELAAFDNWMQQFGAIHS